MKLTLGQAAKETGINKSTIYRAIKEGKLSADFDGKTYSIDSAELFRVFAPASETAETDKETVESIVTQRAETGDATAETMIELRARLDLLTQRNNKLGSELTKEREERRRLMKILAFQENTPSRPEHSRKWPIIALGVLGSLAGLLVVVIIGVSVWFWVEIAK